MYGLQPMGPIRETAPLAPTSPYGLTKLQGEQMLRWMAERRGWSAVSLRYFNPVGAHESGRIGQPPSDAASLVPRVLQAAANPPARVEVFGSDYPTEDGTCLRDYIHVSDLIAAHVDALEYLRKGGDSGIFNCGYGKGYSVLEVIKAVERVNGAALPVKYGPRRAGDPAAIVAGANRVREVLGWQPKHENLDFIVETALNWERKLALRNTTGQG